MAARALLLLLLGISLPVAAGERVVLVEGRHGRSWLDFDVRSSRTENTAPDVIRVEPGRTRGELVFYARRPGKATITVRDAFDDGVSFDVVVLSRRLVDERHALEGLPDSVWVTVEGPYVLVKGVVTPEERAQIDALAADVPNLLVDVRVKNSGTPASIASARIGRRLRAEWRGPEGRRAPDIAPVESDSFERHAVTLLPGTFVVAPHAFRASSFSLSGHDVVEATSEDRRTLFVGSAPGTALYVVRDAQDRRWIVFDVTVLDPGSDDVQRTVPALPTGVRAVLEQGVVVLEGAVTSPDDMGVVEAVTAIVPDVVDRVQRQPALPIP